MSRRKSMFTSGFISAQATGGLPASGAAVTAKTRRLTPDELEDLFKNCIKLSSENKITVKNTWQLNLIDYIDEVIENTLNDAQNFQAASCTLDASVKIYSSRVDSVHSETYKVLSGLSRADNRRGATREEDAEEDGERTDRADRRPRRPRVGAQTLEQNDANINIKKFEFEHSIEPLHRSSTGLIDINAYSSLLVNNLSMSNACEIILDTTKSRYDCRTIWKPTLPESTPQEKEDDDDDDEHEEQRVLPQRDDGDGLQTDQDASRGMVDIITVDTALVPLIEEPSQQYSFPDGISDAIPLNESGGFAFGSDTFGGDDGGFGNDVTHSADGGIATVTNEGLDDDNDDDDGLFDYDFEQLLDQDDDDVEQNDADDITEQMNPVTIGVHNDVAETLQTGDGSATAFDTVPAGIDVDNEYAYFDITKTANYNWSGMNSNWRFKSRVLHGRSK